MTLPARTFRAAAAGALIAVSGAALAQSPTARLRGTIERVGDTELVVVSREGPIRSVALAPTARIAAVARAALTDIKAGTYVGTAAMPLPDGSLRAIEVLVFPEAMRGAGEGHRAWDLLPESTMTNATVSDAVTRVEGRTLTLTYKDGAKAVIVPEEAPIVTLIPADRTDLKHGAKVVVTVATGGDGVALATSVIVGKDGVDPPM